MNTGIEIQIYFDDSLKIIIKTFYFNLVTSLSTVDENYVTFREVEMGKMTFK